MVASTDSKRRRGIPLQGFLRAWGDRGDVQRHQKSLPSTTLKTGAASLFDRLEAPKRESEEGASAVVPAIRSATDPWTGRATGV